ncbi:substrate-binding domain-containing protein [Vibrio astriarenae]|uniref:Substrate-binding domain-containing protein n=1 Tax=Vibrio astriarenae TaxID=1481923 RepID=A0A7Z2T6W3_9VIBR|nr:LacI family DNA-binding transcriptional regulator [Vibrio astriarenae]QIA65451.1 substrate-binding domain-containing protein [Vibrio astriarenae]
MQKTKKVKNPTLDHIASLAGVSKTTVSRALNGSELVRDDVMKHVREIAEQAGYVHKAAKIEIPLPLKAVSFYCLDHLANASSFYDQIIHSVRSELEKLSIKVNIVLYNKDFSSSVLARSMKDSDAMLVLGEPFGNLSEALKQSSLPTLLLNGLDKEMKIPSIHPDYELGGLMAGSYLIEKGHRNVKIITSNDRHSTYQRTDGFFRAFSLSGIELDREESTIDLSKYQKGDRVTSPGDFGAKEILPKLVEQGAFKDCTAVFCICDMIAFSFISALAHADISVPEDISVVGFDNLSLTSFVHPRLTTLSVDYSMLANAAIMKLVRLSNESNGIGNRTTIPVTVVERDTVIDING